MDLDRTRDVLAAFEREEVRYVIIGAVALNEGAFHVDRLTRLGEAHDFEDLESERVDFDGLEVTIATPCISTWRTTDGGQEGSRRQ